MNLTAARGKQLTPVPVILDAVFFQVSEFEVTSFTVIDSLKTSYIFVGIDTFGVLIVDINDFNRRLWIDVMYYINWVDPLPSDFVPEDLGIVVTT